MRERFLASLLLLSACADRIERPVADPGAAPALPAVGGAVQLDGGASSDPQDRPLTFLWSLTALPAGSQASFHDARVANPSFVPDIPGDYGVQLVVSNGVLDSEPASLTVVVTTCGAGVPVVDSAQAEPAAPATGQTVRLSAAVTDADNAKDCNLGQELFYRWDLVELPPGSQAEIPAPTARNPSFAPDVPGSYVIELVVTDSTGRSSEPAAVMVDAGTCGTNPPVPGALLAIPSSPATGQAVQLSAPAAADADTDLGGCGLAQTLAYQWALTAAPAGSLAALNDPASTRPSFTPDVVGTYSIQLTLADSTGRFGTSTLDVTAGPCGSNPPVALIAMANPVTTAAGSAVFAPDVAVGTDIQLDAGASSDADATGCGLSDPLSYAWSFDRLAPASNASFNAATLDPSFTADRPGTYVVRLTVTDSTGLAGTATLTVTADPCVVLALPGEFTCTTIRSGGPQGLDAPQGVTVDGAGSIYVVNQGADNVVRIVPGAITVFADGGFLNGNLADIVRDPGSGTYFVTDTGDDEIIQLSATGLPTLFADGGAVQEPRSIASFTDCAGFDWLLVASFGSDEVMGFDPIDAPLAMPQFVDLMTTFGGPDLAIEPQGVAGQCSGAVDRIYATRTAGGPDGLIRDEADIAGVVDDAALLSSNVALADPRDVVLTPCSPPKAVVAGRGAGTVVVVDDCGGVPCPVAVLASGMDEPWGLWFESDSSLLVTDRGSNTLHRITATNPGAFDFCDL